MGQIHLRMGSTFDLDRLMAFADRVDFIRVVLFSGPRKW